MAIRGDVKGAARQRAYNQTPHGAAIQRAAHARYRASPKGRRTALKSALKLYYGITLDEYDAMLEKQGGHCALCDRTELVVDHCHETGRFRGLLCRPHNVAIGALGDNTYGLQRALEYLSVSA